MKTPKQQQEFSNKLLLYAGLKNHVPTKNTDTACIWVDLEEKNIHDIYDLGHLLAVFFGIDEDEELDSMEDVYFIDYNGIPECFFTLNKESTLDLDEDFWALLDYGWQCGVSEIDIVTMERLFHWADYTSHNMDDWSDFEDADLGEWNSIAEYVENNLEECYGCDVIEALDKLPSEIVNAIDWQTATRDFRYEMNILDGHLYRDV